MATARKYPIELTEKEIRVITNLLEGAARRAERNLKRNQKRGWKPGPGKRDANAYMKQMLAALSRRMLEDLALVKNDVNEHIDIDDLI